MPNTDFLEHMYFDKFSIFIENMTNQIQKILTLQEKKKTLQFALQETFLALKLIDGGSQA